VAAPVIAVLANVHPADGPERDAPIRHASEAPAAAEELGRALATAGLSIAVYSCSDRYLDSHVVDGFLAASGKRQDKARIHVWHSQGSPDGDFQGMADAEYSGVFSPHLQSNTDDWSTTFFRSMKAVDGVVVIGGRDFSFVAALWTLGMSLPLSTVAYFGGGAAKAWPVLKAERGLAEDEEIEVMGLPWSSTNLETLVSGLKKQVARKKGRESSDAAWSVTGSMMSIILSVATIGIFVASLLLVAPGSRPYFGLVLFGPLVAGTAGAMLRVTWEESTPPRSLGKTCALGIGIGAAYILLFIISQASANQSLFDPTVVLKPGPAALLSATALGLAYGAGFALDTALDKMKRGIVERTLSSTSGDGPSGGTTETPRAKSWMQ
jgi:hypothetical protein